MKVVGVYVRFFRSFNYDYEYKARRDSKPALWEDPEPWYPFVNVSLDSDITAVVGANEAGKSQLLTAVKAGITGSPIERADFCRYSDEYSVQKNMLRYPEFGIEISLGGAVDALSGILNSIDHAQPFTLYRPGRAAPFIVQNGARHDIDAATVAILNDALPEIFILETDLAIPDSVSIKELVDGRYDRLDNRTDRAKFFDLFDSSTESDDEPSWLKKIQPFIKPKSPRELELDARRRKEFELARKLLVDAAQIDPDAFIELQTAIRSGKEGQVESIIGAMNTAIRENLNVQRWWSQDQAFELVVEAREYEIAFTILDRTRRKYSFEERSQGLRFFLSYFVQLTAHRLTKKKPDVLLLDEPDAYLSSIGQQDLLRVLTDYTNPEDGGVGGQVVYVTHSPFLIDKNHPHRIRVLDKGAKDEGTRVVKDAANNRYEPLRSSLGAYVAETAFIGGRNLFVEGAADQILIAGTAASIARVDGISFSTLDLNEVTVVACGGADAVPYMAYLARGRDSIKPPCVALLDGDDSGKRAEKVLKRGEARQKRVLRDEFIVRLDLWFAGSGLEPDPGVIVKEIEDLIPLSIAHRAALNHLSRFRQLEQKDLTAFELTSLRGSLEACGGSVWQCVEAAYGTAFEGEHIEKAGFAREVIAALSLSDDAGGIDVLKTRFSDLFGHLSRLLDDAASEEERNRTTDRFRRAISNFEANYPRGISKNGARRLLRELKSAIDASDLSDEIVPRLLAIERDYGVQDPVHPTIADFEGFKDSISSLAIAERISYQDDARKDPAGELIRSEELDGAAVEPEADVVGPEPLVGEPEPAVGEPAPTVVNPETAADEPRTPVVE